MSEPRKSRDKNTTIIFSWKRDCLPSLEVHDSYSPEEQNPEEDECTESEQELNTRHDESQTKQKVLEM